MAKLKVQGNASGTGVVTLTAPNTNTDRTITLPDGDITLGGGVDGIVSTANATAITIDANENVGIGVVPESDWGGRNALQLGEQATWGALSHISTFGHNCQTRTGGVDYYMGATANEASQIQQYNGAFSFKVAPSGTADTAISWTTPLTITNDGRGLSQFTAKAWVHFDGTGTVAIEDSHNVSSITDTSVGSYYVNLANSMANTKYCVLGSSSQGASAATNYNNHVCVQNINYNYKYQLLMRPQAASDTMVDIGAIFSVVFGD